MLERPKKRAQKMWLFLQQMKKRLVFNPQPPFDLQPPALGTSPGTLREAPERAGRGGGRGYGNQSTFWKRVFMDV
jgi:hypothetical protein